MKQIYLASDKKFLGVCGGIAEYFGVDPTLIRIAVACVALYTAVVPALIIYVVMSFVFPQQPEGYTVAEPKKKLMKSSQNKKVSGVCAGIAKYFGMDATIVRLLFAICMLAIGFGLTIYIVCLALMPTEPEQVITDR
jgi:phage shock protein PspC (stress-responsive transcriptional regulator)